MRSYGLTNSAVLRWALEVVGPRAGSLRTPDGYVSALELLKSFMNERRSNVAIVCRYVALFVGVYRNEDRTRVLSYSTLLSIICINVHEDLSIIFQRQSQCFSSISQHLHRIISER